MIANCYNVFLPLFLAAEMNKEHYSAQIWRQNQENLNPCAPGGAFEKIARRQQPIRGRAETIERRITVPKEPLTVLE